MKFESFFRSKSKEELKKQESQVSDNLETNLVHDSMKSDLELLPVNELKEKYQLRYNTYLAMLRGERKSDDNIQNEAKDINKAKIYINALNNLDNYIQEQARGERKVLRGKQIHFLNEIRDALERGVTRGYIKLPTGVGKTVLFSQLLEALKLKAFIGVPTLPLVKQTSDRLETFTNRTHGIYSGKKKDLTKEITTITYQSLIPAVRNSFIKPEDVPIFIADEAHKILGPETSNALKEFGLVLEFTATPGNKNLPEKICEMTLNEAIKEGLVCRTKTLHAHTDVDLSSVPIDHGDYDKKELEKKINTHGRNMAALELYKNKFSHLKAMVNCTGRQHSKDVAELFIKNGIKSAHIDGETSDEEEEKIFKKLSKGEIMVVTNAKLLLEGFDESSLSVVLNLDPTISMTKAEQRGGRALRLDDSNPEKWGYVVDFIDKNTKRKPVLFSEILEGAVVTPGEDIETENEAAEEINKPTNSETKDEEKDQIEKIPKPENENKENDFDGISDTEDIEEKSTNKPKKPPRDYDPIDWSDLNIDGLRIVVDVKEIMEVTKENQVSRRDNIPEQKPGWFSASMFKAEFGGSRDTIAKEAEKYRPEHPEWFEVQRSRTSISEFYHPILVAILKEKFKIEERVNIPKQKPGWFSASMIKTEFGGSKEAIVREAEKYRPEYPEWFEVQRTHGRDAECYHPELVEILVKIKKQENSKKIIAPNLKPGWESPNALRHRLKIGYNYLLKEAEKYRPEHPEWFEIQKAHTLTTECYSPEFIAIIEKQKHEKNLLEIEKKQKISNFFIDIKLQKNKLEEKEWFNMTQLCEFLGCRFKRVQSILEKYKIEQADWFLENQKDGKLYSSEILQLLKIEIKG